MLESLHSVRFVLWGVVEYNVEYKGCGFEGLKIDLSSAESTTVSRATGPFPKQRGNFSTKIHRVANASYSEFPVVRS